MKKGETNQQNRAANLLSACLLVMLLDLDLVKFAILKHFTTFCSLINRFPIRLCNLCRNDGQDWFSPFFVGSGMLSRSPVDQAPVEGVQR